MATSSAAPRPLSKQYDLDVTIVSAKHLKNVNWRNGDLKPYVILWVDPDRRLATKPDDLGSTHPVWNERFVLPLTFPPRDCALTLEVFHSKPSETSKPLVGTLVIELRDLLADSDDSAFRLRTLELLRPSGRPHGKIRLKVGQIERPVENYYSVPPPGCYYTPTPLPSMPYGGYSPMPYSSLPLPPPSLSPPRPPMPQPPNYGYSDPHTGHYSSYYSPQPPPSRPYYERQSSYGAPERQSSYGAPERQSSYGVLERLSSYGAPPERQSNYGAPERQSNYGAPEKLSNYGAPEKLSNYAAPEKLSNYGAPGPSAPVDYTPYDYHKRSVGKPGIGMGTGLVVGGLAAGLGGLALEEGINHEEEKTAERVDNDLTSTSRNDRYGDF